MAWNEFLQDITDRAGRLLGIVSISGEVEVKNDTGNPLNVTISPGTNNIGDVDVLTLPSLPTGSNTIGAVDVTDKAGRLLGVVSVSNEIEVKNDAGNPLNVAVTSFPSLPAGNSVIGKVGMQVGGVDLSSSNPTFADITDKPARVLGVTTLGAGTASIGKVTAQQLDRISVAPVTGVKTVSTTAAVLFAGASQLASRYSMTVFNESGSTVYFGTSGVTASTGFPLLAGDSVSFSFIPANAIGIYFIGIASSSVRVVELA